MARPSKYMPEFRRRAVEEVLDRERTVTEVARALSITTPETLRRWVVQARIKRDFTASAPNELWLADITYCSTWQGWLYVAFILDVYARVIVGWQIATHMRTDLVIDALQMAAWRRDPAGGGCVHHSDAGSQYTSIRYTDRLATAGIAASVGTVGDCLLSGHSGHSDAA